ncbi:MAG: VanZ family protein [Flavobacteriales bacterium]|nr:VanZ family protein [Flavobacteriales bacterium]
MLRTLRWALLWAVVILVLCLMPGAALPEWNWFALLDLDKLVHAFMFFVLAVLLAQAFIVRGTPVRYLLWACVISIGYGLATEIMQGLEALGRRTDINDMIANSVGALLAAVYVRWRLKKERSIVPIAFLR